jgi:hypothetical protein
LVATPTEAEIAEALSLWPEVNTARIRPLLISAFGDIFVEREDASVWIASPIELSCYRLADSVADLERLFSDPEWGRQRMRTDLVLRAQAEGVTRSPEQVFAIAPHPVFSGFVPVGRFVQMDLALWHNISLQSGPRVTQPGNAE